MSNGDQADLESTSLPRPCLCIVATPIGNLGDTTLRMLATLRTVDCLVAEDTRRARALYSALKIRIPAHIYSAFDAAERGRAPGIIDAIAENAWSAALISDAGTPAVSDPGYHLVRAARARGVAVIPIPGVSAVTTTVSISGLPSDRWVFIGFLPRTEAGLRREIEEWLGRRESLVAFESAVRLPRTLERLATLGSRLVTCEIVIARELTKRHEEIFAGSISEALRWSTDHKTLKGELVLMLSRKPARRAAAAAAGQPDAEELTVGGDLAKLHGAPTWKEVEMEAKAALRRGESVNDLVSKWRGGFDRKTLYRRLVDWQQELREAEPEDEI